MGNKFIDDVTNKVKPFKGKKSKMDDGNPSFIDGYLPWMDNLIEKKIRDIRFEFVTHEKYGKFACGDFEARNPFEDVIKYSHGYEEELADIVSDVIRSEYGAILKGVRLNISVGMATNPYLEMDENTDQRNEDLDKIGDDSDDNIDMESLCKKGHLKEITDEEYKNEAYKRRICNRIKQGCGISTHRIIHLDYVKDRLNDIHPELMEALDMQINMYRMQIT